MKQFGKKLLSLLLVVVLVLQIVPATVFATEETEDLATGNEPLTDATQDIFADNASETIEEFLASAQVLFEEETLREESVKHFRLENGQYLAIAYDTPVHYLDSNGEWQDYDNTLVPLNHNGQLTGYRVQNGDSLRLFSAEANSGQLVAVQTGDYSLALTPVLPADAELPAQPVTPLEPMGDFALEETGITSSAAASVLVTVAPAETVIEDNLMAKVQPEKLYSALEYSGLMDGVSIRYENYANAIKESIVVSAPQSEYIYSFRLQTEGLTPALQESGDILFSTTDGTVIYTIPAPYMIDANNDVSYEAAYTLTNSGSEWILTVTADTAWMNAPQRTYPILIDPTISETTDGDDDICGNFVRAGYPNSPDTTDMGVYVGINGNNNGLSRSFFHVNNLIELPYGCRVNYASLSAYHYSQSGSAVDVEIHELTSNSVQASAGIAAWKTWANNLTWNNQPPYSDIVIDSQKLSTSTTGQYITWDITKLANKWYTDGTTNIGFALVAQNEAATNARSTLYGPRKLSYRPRMAIAYRNIRGIESAYTYQNANAGKAGTAYIGDFAMQNTLVVPLWLSPSNTMPFSVSLVYNSSLSGAYFSSYYQDVNTANYETMHVGVGWMLSLQETVISKTVDGVTYRVYTDADGREHYFLYCSDGYYRDEDGLGLKISGSSSNYTMSDDSGNQKIFTYGYLTETKDAYGNVLYYCYDDEAYSSSSSSWKPSSSTTGHKVTSVYRKNNGGSAAEQILLLGYNGNRLSTIITECNFANDSSKDKHRITLGATTAANGYVLLSGITFPDETTVEYTYDNTQNYRLRTAYDGESNNGIEFTYAPNHDVKTISE